MFTTEFGHVFVVTTEGKSGINIEQEIKKYFKEISVPLQLICNQAQEQVHGYAILICNKEETPATNKAEREINILKDGCKRNMFDTNSPNGVLVLLN